MFRSLGRLGISRGGYMQFCFIMLVLLATVAIGVLWSPMFMPLPLFGWWVVQTLLYYYAGKHDE